MPTTPLGLAGPMPRLGREMTHPTANRSPFKLHTMQQKRSGTAQARYTQTKHRSNPSPKYDRAYLFLSKKAEPGNLRTLLKTSITHKRRIPVSPLGQIMLPKEPCPQGVAMARTLTDGKQRYQAADAGSKDLLLSKGHWQKRSPVKQASVKGRVAQREH